MSEWKYYENTISYHKIDEGGQVSASVLFVTPTSWMWSVFVGCTRVDGRFPVGSKEEAMNEAQEVFDEQLGKLS